MKYLRITFFTIVFVVLICAIAFACLVMMVDANRFKPIITEAVLKKTGYQLVINGPLTWTLYPRLGVNVEYMTVTAPKQPTPFVELHNVKLSTSLIQWLRDGDKWRGTLRIDSLRLMNMEAKNAYVKLLWHKQILTLQPIKAELYDGRMEGMAHAKNMTSMPQWDWNIQLSQIQLKPFLHDLNGSDRKLIVSGTSAVKFIAASEGTTRDQFLRQLNGTFDFSLNKGVVEGLDLNYLVQTADALITHQAIVIPKHMDQTEFQQLTGTAIIKNGVARIDNLLLASEAFTTKGEGIIDLTRQRINYELQVTPQHTEKLRWTVPVLMSGDLRDPSINIDKAALQSIVASEQFKKMKSKVQEEIKKLPKKANEFIKRMMGD